MSLQLCRVRGCILSSGGPLPRVITVVRRLSSISVGNLLRFFFQVETLGFHCLPYNADKTSDSKTRRQKLVSRLIKNQIFHSSGDRVLLWNPGWPPSHSPASSS